MRRPLAPPSKRPGAGAFAELLRPYTARLPMLPFLVVGAVAGQPARHLVGGVVLILSAYGLAAVTNPKRAGPSGRSLRPIVFAFVTATGSGVRSRCTLPCPEVATTDLHDVEVDRANGRNPPLTTGVLTVADARKAMVVCAAGVAVAQLLLVPPLGLAVTLASMAAAAYSRPRLGLERRGVLGWAVLAVAYLVLPALLNGGPLRPLVLAALVAGGTATSCTRT